MLRRNLQSWGQRHWSTCLFIVLHIAFSIAFHFIDVENWIILSIVRLLAAKNVEYVSMNAIFLFLFSGVPVSIGHIQWWLWMTWSAACLFCLRLALGTVAVGPSYVVFCQYLTFIFMHKPFLKFKLGRIAFTDTWLYSLAVLQYIANDPISMCLDFTSCFLSNIAWKGANQLLRFGEHAETN